MDSADAQFDAKLPPPAPGARYDGYSQPAQNPSAAHPRQLLPPALDHDYLPPTPQASSPPPAASEIPQLINQGKDKEAYERLGWFVDVFGRDNFFIELQEHNLPELVAVNKVLVPWADKFGLGMVVTNDVHYVLESDGGPHDVLLCVQTSAAVSAQNRMRMSDGSYFLKSRQQMEAAFRPYLDLPASVRQHAAHAEILNVD